EFNNHKCMQPNPYRIFWDLECLTEKLTPEENTQLTHTEKIQRHKPCGYCYVVICMDSSLNYEIVSHDLYRGSDALERFVIKIEKELLSIQEDLSVPAEMIMAPGDLKAYNEATECWICMRPFIKPSPEILQHFEKAKHRLLEVKEWEACMEKEHQEKKNMQKKYQEALNALNIKVKDHDHINGKYCGPAHNACNKKLRIGSFETKVSLICHNYRGYDSHPLMKVVSKFTANKIKCIPENIGKYKAMD
ncbi:845_t:CDS:1, partial [Gigaspora margarita]